MATRSHCFRTLAASIVFVSAIVGCSTTPDDSRQHDTSALMKFAENAAQEGYYEAAGNAYKQLALIAPAETRPDFQMKAASMLLKGNYIAQAKRALQDISRDGLSPTQQLDINLLAARIALAESNPAAALEALQQAPSPLTSNEQRALYHMLRAQAYSRAGNLIEAVREYIQREPYLVAPIDAPPIPVSEIEDNQLLIWQSLMLLSEEMLQQLRIDPPPDSLSGWLELALLAKSTQHEVPISGAALNNTLTTWHQNYPNIKVSENILASINAWRSGALTHPEKIALLLPMSGNFAGPAEIIRDGFFAAHFNKKTNQPPPSIRLYDTTANGRSAVEQYQQAIDDGADFIVGPLNKVNVESLINNRINEGDAAVPTLTLNYSGNPEAFTKNLYQFGLAPEDEARQLAERAWLDGYNQALAIVPEGEWGARILRAFNDSWEALNGTMAEQQTYASSKNDFSEPLRNLLNIDESQRRKKDLQQLLGTQLKFEPRRRQDADFILMVAFPRQARLIKPQLKFHYAGDLPVYATSHLYSGHLDKEANRDLDQITFCDIPWVLSRNREENELNQRIQQLWPEKNNQYTRFYAMGIDAYNLIPQVGHMATFRYERYRGETGTLSLDESNRIYRQLPWARFKRGIARPL